MIKTKKLLGFRFGESIPKWKDRFGRGGGKIIKLTMIKHCKKIQILISNGDILTSEYMTQDQFHERKLRN